MEGLDFSALSDDQLLGLIRAALREITTRSPALSEAAHAAMLDEHERVGIAKEAGDREAARLRALERSRVAEEAAARVRADRDAAERTANAGRAQAAAEKARTDAQASEERGRAWLRRAAALVEKDPGAISIMVLNTGFGRRVLINDGNNRYERDHLVDWNASHGGIKTTQALVRRKPDLAALAAEFNARYAGRELFLAGIDYDWSTP